MVRRRCRTNHDRSIHANDLKSKPANKNHFDSAGSVFGAG